MCSFSSIIILMLLSESELSAGGSSVMVHKITLNRKGGGELFVPFVLDC